MEMLKHKRQGSGSSVQVLPSHGSPCPHDPPPRCPLQTSLLRDLMMHPHSPGRRSACLPPIPHSSMALCNHLIPAKQVAPLVCSPDGYMPGLCTRHPSCSMHPQPQPRVQLNMGLFPDLLGESMRKQWSQRHLMTPTPITSPQPSQRETAKTPACSLVTLPHCHEGLCSDSPLFSHQNPIIPKSTHLLPEPEHLGQGVAAWLAGSKVGSRLGSPQKASVGAGGSSYPLLGAAGLTFIFRRELYKLAFLSGLSSRNCVKLNGNELH